MFSYRERRRLEDIERQLADDDPALAVRMQRLGCLLDDDQWSPRRHWHSPGASVVSLWVWPVIGVAISAIVAIAVVLF